MNDFLGIPRTAMEVFNMLPEGTLCEVVDNALYMLPVPNTLHQRVLGTILSELHTQLRESKAGTVLMIPCDVYFDEQTVVIPDIFFIKDVRRNIMQEKGIYGAPDLIIEILLDNKVYDQEFKLALYRRYHVPEYIIIDPETKQVWHHILKEQQYVLQAVEESGKLFIQQLNLSIAF